MLQSAILSHHHFCSKVRICLLPLPGPGRSSPQAGSAGFVVESSFCEIYASILCSTLRVIFSSTISFHPFFGPSFFVAFNLKWSAFAAPLSLFIVFTYPSHCCLCSRRNSSIPSNLSFQESCHCLLYPLGFFHKTCRTLLFLLSSVFFYFSPDSPTFSAITQSSSIITFL